MRRRITAVAVCLREVYLLKMSIGPYQVTYDGTLFLDPRVVAFEDGVY
jgi:hypothetical protein